MQKTGGTITGDLNLDGGSGYGKITLYVDGVDGAYIRVAAADGTETTIFPNQLWIHPDGGSGYGIAFPTSAGTLALLSDMYAVVQKIAPAFTAKEYGTNELCSYNNVIYRCKAAYTSTAASATPDVDTTNWESTTIAAMLLGFEQRIAALESALSGLETALHTINNGGQS